MVGGLPKMSLLVVRRSNSDARVPRDGDELQRHPDGGEPTRSRSAASGKLSIAERGALIRDGATT